MKFGRIVLQVNSHQLTECNIWHDVMGSRWRPCCHFIWNSAAVDDGTHSVCPARMQWHLVSSRSLVNLYLYLLTSGSST